MLKYIAKRVLVTIPVLIGVVFMIFVMLSVVPGDPLTVMMGEKVKVDVIERLSVTMHLNDPWYVRFVWYLWDALHGDFGTSYKLTRSCQRGGSVLACGDPGRDHLSGKEEFLSGSSLHGLCPVRGVHTGFLRGHVFTEPVQWHPSGIRLCLSRAPDPSCPGAGVERGRDHCPPYQVQPS